MIKQKQIELLEEEIKDLTGELMESTIVISNLRTINEEHKKLNGELREKINKAIHRIQLLQMDGEVSIKDLGLIVKDLKGEE